MKPPRGEMAFHPTLTALLEGFHPGVTVEVENQVLKLSTKEIHKSKMSPNDLLLLFYRSDG